MEKIDPLLLELWRRLDFVTWDRYAQDPTSITSYGWITREDDRSDFIVLELDLKSGDVSYTTSSAQYTEEISRRLYGSTDTHNTCQRIEDIVTPSELPNCVRLEPDDRI